MVMARAIWSGAVSFGLVSIPVKLYPATEAKDVQFHQLEKKTGKRIRYKRVAGDSNREVDYQDIVKGYEIKKGRYIVVTPEELEAVEPTRSRTIEIEDFVDLEEIDPIYYEKTYLLAPQGDSGADKPYALLLQAMERAGKVGIAHFVLRTKQYLAAIRPMDGLLALETMFFADEIRGTKDLDNVPVKTKASPRELQIAGQLIDSQSVVWDPTKYDDTYRERVLKLVRDKAKGKEIVAEPEAEPAKVHDLMEALRASVEAAKQGTASSRRSASRSGGRRRTAARKAS
jgi:DNA end-binding protein Ku